MNSTTLKHRTVPIPETITSIGGGYPDKLAIFKIPASKYWWVRYFVQGKLLKKSTKATLKSEAKKYAEKFYEDILLRQRNLLPLTKSHSFERVANELLKEQQILINRGERNEKLNKNDSQKLQKDILPFFKGYDIKDITYRVINEYIAHISKRNLKPATLKLHLNLIHKVFVLAQRENILDTLPQMPRIKMKDNPRGWFTESEYELLRKTAAQAAKDKLIVRYHLVTDELRLLITFMTNTFLRPSDVKNLRHRNIEIINSKETYLRIQTENSKTNNNPIVSMKAAVGIYQDLIDHHKKNGNPHSKNDYIFFPKIENREFAFQTMRRQFDAILARAELKNSSTGEPRTLYSLRHTAIMFRLTLGEHIDVITLARNARTSVEMIDRFYAKPLQAEMNVAKIQSMRKEKTS